MKTDKTILLLAGLAWSAVAQGAPVQSTNDVQQRALDVLRQTMDSLQKSPPARRAAAPPREPTFAEVEQLYLQGKITAKEFQKYLEDHKLDPAKLPNRGAQTPVIETSRKEVNKLDSGQTTSPAAKPDRDAEPVQPPPDQPGLSELEKKMDELLRLKAARENGLGTNATPNASINSASPPAAKSKRERLDALLKLYIEGKLPEAEYKEKRAKLILEPD